MLFCRSSLHEIGGVLVLVGLLEVGSSMACPGGFKHWFLVPGLGKYRCSVMCESTLGSGERLAGFSGPL